MTGEQSVSNTNNNIVWWIFIKYSVGAFALNTTAAIMRIKMPAVRIAQGKWNIINANAHSIYTDHLELQTININICSRKTTLTLLVKHEFQTIALSMYIVRDSIQQCPATIVLSKHLPIMTADGQKCRNPFKCLCALWPQRINSAF